MLVQKQHSLLSPNKLIIVPFQFLDYFSSLEEKIVLNQYNYLPTAVFFFFQTTTPKQKQHYSV